MEDVPAEQVAATTALPMRIGAIVLGAFGILALGLGDRSRRGAAYAVSCGTRDIGIRIALGVSRVAVLRRPPRAASSLPLPGCAR